MDVSRVYGSITDPVKKREAVLSLAKGAERAERFSDMCHFMHELVKLGGALSPSERELLMISHARVSGSLRTSYKTLEAEIKVRELDDLVEPVTFGAVLVDFQKQLATEIKQMCVRALEVLETHLNPRKRTAESDLIACTEYLRLIGDYHFYLAELGEQASGKKAVEAYLEALELAQQTKLPCMHPTLLHVTLNYSVCLKEIFRETKQACQIAKAAFDQAINNLEDLDKAAYNDSTLILQLVRDNLTLWNGKDGKPGSKPDSGQPMNPSPTAL